MIKLLMTWDIKPGRETAYLDFVNQTLTPELMQLGLEPTEVWYTYWGEGPQIAMGFVAESAGAVRQMLRQEKWGQLHKQLDEHVLDFRYKLIPASGLFQL